MNCSFNDTKVNVQLLRYIIRLLNISKDDLSAIKSDCNKSNQWHQSLTRQNNPECEKCVELFYSQMASSKFQNKQK